MFGFMLPLRRLTRSLLLAPVALLCANAHAGAEWVAGAYLGAAHTRGGALTIAQPGLGTELTLASVDYRGESFTSPVYYGYRIAYFPPRFSWLGIEGEFIHAKVYARTDATTPVSGRLRGSVVSGELPIRAVVESFSISHGLNFVLANAVVRYAVREGTGGVTLLARAGLGPTVPHPESRIAGEPYEGYELGALGRHLAGGLEIRMWRGVALAAEYKFTHTDQTVAVARGHAAASLTTHHGGVGISWHF